MSEDKREQARVLQILDHCDGLLGLIVHRGDNPREHMDEYKKVLDEVESITRNKEARAALLREASADSAPDVSEAFEFEHDGDVYIVFDDGEMAEVRALVGK